MSDEVPAILYSNNPYKQHVAFIRFQVLSSLEDKVFKIGRIPRDALIVDIYAIVKTVFDAAKIKLGTTEEVNDLSEADVSKVGKQVVALANKQLLVGPYEEITVYGKLDKKVQSGEAIIIIEYIPDH